MRIFVKPAPGLMPRAPIAPFERIPAEGLVTEDGSHWRRLELAGDVVISLDPSEAQAKPQAKKGA